MAFYPSRTMDAASLPDVLTLTCGSTTVVTAGMLCYVSAGVALPLVSTITNQIFLATKSATATATTFQAMIVTTDLILRTTSSSTVVTNGQLYTADLTDWQCGTTAVTGTTNTVRVMPIRQHDTGTKVAGTTGTLYDVLIYTGYK